MASTFNLPSSFSVVLVNTVSTPKVLYLPAASTVGSGYFLTVKDICGNAAASSIYLSTKGLDRIDNTPSTVYGIINTNNAAVTMTSDGIRNWMIIGYYSNNLINSLPVFKPTDLSGLQLWLDGSDSSTASMTLSGINITTWKDKSGNGNNTTGGSGTVTLQANAINGLSAASFTNTYFTGPFATTNTGYQYQAFAVATMNASSTAYGRILALGRPGVYDFAYPDTSFAFIRNNGGLQIMNGRNSVYNIVNLPAYNVPFLVQSSQNSNMEYIGVNGTLTPQSANTGVTTAFNITSYGVGTNTDTSDAGSYWYGYIGEIVYYNVALTTQQRQKVEGYLAWKWRIEDKLPPTHPYYNNPP